MLAAILTITSPAEAVTVPSTTTSYYVTTTDSRPYATAGCNQGTADKNRAGTQNRIVVLDFGTPSLSGSTYGVDLPGAAGFASRAQIQDDAYQFAYNYWSCTGSDTASHLTLVLGENNEGSQVVTNATQQGRAWSNFVSQVRAASGAAAAQVDIQGGYDMEVGWNNAGPSLALLDGYFSINSNFNYDHGDAAGCPTDGRADCVTREGYVWSIEDRYQAAWGRSRSYSIPQIYNSSMAAEWGNMSRYGAHAHSTSTSAIYFSGVMDQYQACVDESDPCIGTNYTASQAYTALWNQLQLEADTAMTPRWGAEIRWNHP
ncbi:hypothetical protein M6D93_01600 [Jatrophihabitans telluris]|uniref:Uncharacterized protein n=1 Tax=Jatrophihabitans telluris TaxID=2038343 RepID=A0ABY4R0M8_9ACTN|nr:hypothetical protein [Jatrophihabitans telluris]UQX88710.1 hypothetical protein M6D93_01600 [Jatrophihabitans telluris]